MKTLKCLLAIAALTGIAVAAYAATITLSPFGDVPKNGTAINGENSDNAENNFFQISGDDSVSFQQGGSGPNGFGAISAVDLCKYEGDHIAPDTGATALLLGSTLTGLGLVRRYLKR
jgi:hypothetical protein